MDELGGRLRRRHAGLPGERPHGLQGPPVRRRPAAVRQPDAPPPADADDRCQPGARAAGAAAGTRRASAWSTTACVAQRRGGHRASASRRCAPRAWRSPSSTRVADDDLRALAAAARDLPLVVAGSGLAIGIPALHGLAPERARPRSCRRPRGTRAVVSGSCSAATQRAGGGLHRGRRRGLRDRPAAAGRGRRRWPAEALAWARPRLGAAPVLVYATRRAGGGARGAAAARRGARRRAGGADAVARSRAAWSQAGVGQLIVAGGETSGACVQAPGRHAAAHRRRRSTPACPGAMRHAGARRACTWR